MASAQAKAAEALYSLRSAFHELGGLTLRGIGRILVEDELVQLEFDFKSRVLVIKANDEDDTIDFWVVDSARQGSELRRDAGLILPWETHVGRKFGWGWVTVNQQGYLDGILLGFDGITPQLLITCIASSLKVRVVQTLRDPFVAPSDITLQ